MKLKDTTACITCVSNALWQLGCMLSVDEDINEAGNNFPSSPWSITILFLLYVQT